MTDPVALADRWLDALASSTVPLEDVAALLAEDVRSVEHPNRARPDGADHDRAALLDGIVADRQVLAWQRFEDRRHDQLGPDRVVVRARWSAQVARAMADLEERQVIRADVARFLAFRDGLLVRQECFDCHQRPR